jgi:predicted dinucleotide-binding enzyme
MKVAVIGSGIVGETLADGFLSEGHEVLRASRNPAKLEAWRSAAGPNARVGTFEDAAAFGECVVLAVLGAAAEAAVDRCGPERLAGKIVIDTTNPIDEAPPEDGVLRYFTEPNDSLMERLQARAPAARFVKAFSCVGNALMIRPDFGGEKPTMFICGDDADAKARVGELLDAFGWETADMGTAKAARAIEPLAMLWCIPGFRENRWTHAFRLLAR